MGNKYCRQRQSEDKACEMGLAGMLEEQQGGQRGSWEVRQEAWATPAEFALLLT